MNDANNGYDRLLERRIEAIEKKQDDQQDDLDSLKSWRSWVLGIVGGVGLMIGAFAKNVADIVRHL